MDFNAGISLVSAMSYAKLEMETNLQQGHVDLLWKSFKRTADHVNQSKSECELLIAF